LTPTAKEGRTMNPQQIVELTLLVLRIVAVFLDR
jgi:hypothetical protein